LSRKPSFLEPDVAPAMARCPLALFFLLNAQADFLGRVEDANKQAIVTLHKQKPHPSVPEQPRPNDVPLPKVLDTPRSAPFTCTFHLHANPIALFRQHNSIVKQLSEQVQDPSLGTDHVWKNLKLPPPIKGTITWRLLGDDPFQWIHILIKPGDPAKIPDSSTPLLDEFVEDIPLFAWAEEFDGKRVLIGQTPQMEDFLKTKIERFCLKREDDAMFYVRL